MSYEIKTQGTVVTVTGSIIDAWAADESGTGGGVDARDAADMQRAYRQVAGRIADKTGKTVEVYASAEGCQDWMIEAVEPRERDTSAEEAAEHAAVMSDPAANAAYAASLDRDGMVVGSRVGSSVDGEDEGVVVSLHAAGEPRSDGLPGMAVPYVLVAWDSGVTTPCDPADLSLL